MYLVIALVSIVPVIVLTRNYLKSAITDYLIFSLLQLVNFLNFMTLSFIQITNLTILIKLHWVLNTATLILILLHSSRLLREEAPNGYLIAIMMCFVFICGYIFSLEEVPVNSPATMPGISFSLLNSASLRSETFNFFILFYNLFYIGTASILFHSYHQIKLINPNQQIVNAYRWMRYTVWLVLISGIFAVAWNYNYRAELIGINLTIALLIISYVSVRYPEVIILSHAQVFRALKLYDQIDRYSEPAFSIEGIQHYISTLPDDLLREYNQ